MEKTFTARANAFRKIETISVMVTCDSVLVWDSIAGHYTSCHSLSAGAMKRIRKMADEI